jgi:hypothetical protein
MTTDDTLDFDVNDLHVDTFRAPGQGGWSTKPETVVRITHMPSRFSITEGDDRSQHRNKVEALRKLRIIKAFCPEVFESPPPPKFPDHAALRKAWDDYRGDAELTLDDAFIFAAGYIAGASNK